jgi:hypothetical protein
LNVAEVLDGEFSADVGVGTFQVEQGVQFLVGQGLKGGASGLAGPRLFLHIAMITI